jgi:hypothetical protein
MKLTLLLWVSATAFAQPPAEQALRARVGELFQSFERKDFKAAHSVVAEDSKDYFFNAPMGDFTVSSCTIKRTQFLNSDLTKASVDLECQQKLHDGEFAGKTIPVPLAALWKIEGGKWVWYHAKGAPRHFL